MHEVSSVLHLYFHWSFTLAHFYLGLHINSKPVCLKISHYLTIPQTDCPLSRRPLRRQKTQAAILCKVRPGLVESDRIIRSIVILHLCHLSITCEALGQAKSFTPQFFSPILWKEIQRLHANFVHEEILACNAQDVQDLASESLPQVIAIALKNMAWINVQTSIHSAANSVGLDFDDEWQSAPNSVVEGVVE